MGIYYHYYEIVTTAVMFTFWSSGVQIPHVTRQPSRLSIEDQ